jgi:hypothetical protein
MSIVSGMNDMLKASVKKQPGNAVQWGFDSVPDVLNAPQLPTINQFRKIRVPSSNPRPAPKGTDIPVKFKQEGDDYQRTATEMFECTKLPVAPMKTSKMDFSMLLNETTMTTDPPFNYNLGIKPAPRRIKFDAITEPTGDLFRS